MEDALKHLGEAFLALTGPLRPLLDDVGVRSIVLNGSIACLVERDGRTTEGPILDEETVAKLARAACAEDALSASAFIDAAREVTVLAAPHLPGGAIVSFELRRTERLSLSSLAPVDVIGLLRAMLAARVSVLVVGSRRADRAAVLNALVDAVPAEEPMLLFDPHHLVASERARLIELPPSSASFDAAPRLGGRWLCLPELDPIGAAGLRACAHVGAALGSCAGEDVHGALALLHSVDCGVLCGAAFRAVIGLADGSGAVVIQALHELAATDAARMQPRALWERHGDRTSGMWQGPPSSFAHRLAFAGPTPWDLAASVDTGVAGVGSMFEVRGLTTSREVVAQVPPAGEAPPPAAPVEVTSPNRKSPREKAAESNDVQGAPGDPWEISSTNVGVDPAPGKPAAETAHIVEEAGPDLLRGVSTAVNEVKAPTAEERAAALGTPRETPLDEANRRPQTPWDFDDTTERAANRPKPPVATPPARPVPIEPARFGREAPSVGKSAFGKEGPSFGKDKPAFGREVGSFRGKPAADNRPFKDAGSYRAEIKTTTPAAGSGSAPKPSPSPRPASPAAPRLIGAPKAPPPPPPRPAEPAVEDDFEDGVGDVSDVFAPPRRSEPDA